MRPLTLVSAAVFAGLSMSGLSAAQATPKQPFTQGVGVYPSAAVAADHPIASKAGLEILRAGGNAVDAAVATSFALSVVRPQSCGIGGGGFMIIHLRDDPRHGTITTAINYREQAPAAVGPDYFEKTKDQNASTHGGKAVGVPGTVAGLLYALEKYGTLDRKNVLAPAIRAAEQGFTADQHYVDSAKEALEWLDKQPGRRARFAEFHSQFLLSGSVRPGSLVQLPDQAKALREIAERGADAFVTGPIADALVRVVRGDKGSLTRDDLGAFKVVETAPLKADFLGNSLYMMPPPSSGGIVITQALEMLELRRDEIRRLNHNSAPYIHLVTEAMKHAFADRARWMGDPAFVDVPIDRLLAPSYIRARAALFNPARTLKPEQYGTSPQLPEDHGTSHLSVVDARGNAVACTETINLIFGSYLVVPGYGFILNNEMDDFLTRRGEKNAFGLEQSERNLPAPGKRPLSSMSPIIGTNKDGVMLVAGASGGPRIISSTLEVALNVLVFDKAAGEAVSLPRFHHQWMPDLLGLEAGLRSGTAEKELVSLGHRTEEKPMVGTVQLIRRARSGAGWEACSDPRKGGSPAGY